MVWPIPSLQEGIEELLVHYYDREVYTVGDSTIVAPITEVDKSNSATDPDSLWEAYAPYKVGGTFGPTTACHGASSEVDFIDCTGARLAATVHPDLPYSGGLTLFVPPSPEVDRFSANSIFVEFAGQYALYHAFVYDFDAPVDSPYPPPNARAQRDNKRYHKRMIRAYERHMRDILTHMLTDTRQDANFQLSLTREVGWLLTPYVRTAQAIEEYDAWGNTDDRRLAIALINGLNQRVWWEWVVPQPNGPRTAGKAELGSQAVFDEWLRREPGLQGLDRFSTGGAETSPSLRPEDMAAAPYDGLWFDADYSLPGEWYCYLRFHPSGGTNWQRCMDLARQESLGGIKSPFGQYYGDGDCSRRAATKTDLSCGETNLGSMAEEWMGTYVGGRAGMRLIQLLAEVEDPDAPSGAIGPGAYATVTERLGFGVAGFHGGVDRHDDMEWLFEQPAGKSQAIRTLSAGLRDGDPQEGNRYSLGERDLPLGRPSGTKGDFWSDKGEEYPGAIENHMPGPNPLYGSVLANQVLSDKIDGQMSPSLYNGFYRGNPDEFETWVWLLQSTFYRCRGVADPADPSCFAFSEEFWPYPSEVKRQPLFIDPSDSSVAPAMRYLWRDNSQLVGDALVAEEDGSCARWRHPALAFSRLTQVGGGPDRYLVTESGFGAYNLIIPSAGAFLRLAAARASEPVSEPDLADEWQLQLSEVLEPWYFEMEGLATRILEYYGPDGLDYLPDAENALCTSDQGSRRAPMAMRRAAGESIASTIAWRARWYSAAALWYWWYDSDWLDVDSTWRGESAGEGILAFESFRYGQADVFSMRPDGSEVRRLTNDPSEDGQATWSPDGRSLVFMSGRTGNADLFRLDLADGRIRQLTNDPAYEGEPSWSPDGQLIVFHADRDENGPAPGEIYTVPAEGGPSLNLTQSPDWDYGPYWSPDASRIAFVRDDGSSTQVHLMRADGAYERCVTCGLGLRHAAQPGWSPDGRTLAFQGASQNGTVQNDVWVVSIDGVGLSNLTADMAATNQEPAWSPDGKWIAFESDIDGDFEIFIMRADGSSKVQVTQSEGHDGNPAWFGNGVHP